MDGDACTVLCRVLLLFCFANQVESNIELNQSINRQRVESFGTGMNGGIGVCKVYSHGTRTHITESSISLTCSSEEEKEKEDPRKESTAGTTQRNINKIMCIDSVTPLADVPTLHKTLSVVVVCVVCVVVVLGIESR
mmetsp:Transcript_13348/g.31209  ORF Transcript_13348/g.31209 Transcript_13348/m.31209 type:complete len:137 (-) Transcript_13348:428-838(-)